MQSEYVNRFYDHNLFEQSNEWFVVFFCCDVECRSSIQRSILSRKQASLQYGVVIQKNKICFVDRDWESSTNKILSFLFCYWQNGLFAGFFSPRVLISRLLHPNQRGIFCMINVELTCFDNDCVFYVDLCTGCVWDALLTVCFIYFLSQNVFFCPCTSLTCWYKDVFSTKELLSFRCQGKNAHFQIKRRDHLLWS